MTFDEARERCFARCKAVAGADPESEVAEWTVTVEPGEDLARRLLSGVDVPDEFFDELTKAATATMVSMVMAGPANLEVPVRLSLAQVFYIGYLMGGGGSV